MKSTGGSEPAKRRAGRAAAERVTDGMVVGLGTGSTAAYAIDALGERVGDGLDIRGVPTSFSARRRALAAGIRVVDLDEVERVDLAIDGADQLVLESGVCIKGGGAAHTREKLVASAADGLHVVVDETKLAERLDHPVALEVLPAAHRVVADAVAARGGEPTLRAAERKDGPVVTDNGNLVVDCDFGPIEQPAALAAALSGLAGVVDHGLFVERVTAVSVGGEDVETVEYRSP